MHSVKSPKIYDQIIESKFFQRIVLLFDQNQIQKPFFRGIDVVKLFYNIVNDSEIFNTRKHRKKNFIDLFNKISNHILLPDDYQTIISDGKQFMSNKKWRYQDEEKICIDDRTLSILTTPMLKELLEYKNIDVEYIKNYFIIKKDNKNYF